MSEFIKNQWITGAVRVTDVSAAMLNPHYQCPNGEKKPAVIFILKSGEKATLIFDEYDDAKEIVEKL